MTLSAKTHPFLLSIIIPAYNEAQRISQTVEKIVEYLQTVPFDAEILVVNDGSTDGTKEILEQLERKYPCMRAIHLPKNRGKGYAVRCGVFESQGEFVLFSDADLSTPITEIPKFLTPLFLEEYDIVIGSRKLAASDIHQQQPWHRRLMGFLFARLVQILVLRGIHDTQCGFKAFRGSIAKNLFQLQRFERFSFDVEILYLAKKHGYRVKEAPVCWADAQGSKVRVLKDSFKMFVDMFRIRFRIWLPPFTPTLTLPRQG